MNPIDKGKLSELMVLERLIREGYEVAIPYGQQKGWDLLVKVDGKWEQWQIKTVRDCSGFAKEMRIILTQRVWDKEKKEVVSVAHSMNPGYDWLIGVNAKTGEMWKVPGHFAAGKFGVYLKAGRFQWAKRGELTGTAQLKLVRD